MLLSFGPRLDPKNIKEGDDVYFECHVKSNPTVYNVTWRHNVRKQKFCNVDDQNQVLHESSSRASEN